MSCLIWKLIDVVAVVASHNYHRVSCCQIVRVGSWWNR